MIFGPPNQEPRLEDLSLLLHYRNPQISSAPMTLKPACQSAPTTFTAHPTTLQGHTYDLLTRMSGVHLRPSPPEIRILKVTPTTLKPACQEPSQLYLLPFKVTPTTCKPACQERTYNNHRMTYDPSRSHLRPSNRMSGSHDDPFRTLAEYKDITQSAWKEEGLNNPQSNTVPRSFFSVVWCSHCQSAQNVAKVFLSNRAFELRFLISCFSP